MDLDHGLGGAFASGAAGADGLSRQQVRTLETSGALTAPHHGVRAHTGDESLAARVGAAGLVLPPGAAFSRRTAAELSGFDPRTPDERDQRLLLECTVPLGRTALRQRGIRSFVADLPDGDLAVVQGVLCTGPARTAADLLRYLPRYMGLAVVDAMAHAGRVSLAEVAEVLARYPGDRFIAQARTLLAAVDPRTESYGESWQRLRILDAGFPPPQVQIPILDGSGREVYRLDMGYPEIRTAFEYDGAEFHDSHARRAHDEARREELWRRFGWTVVGCGFSEILGRSMAFERAVGEALGMTPTIRRRAW